MLSEAAWRGTFQIHATALHPRREESRAEQRDHENNEGVDRHLGTRDAVLLASIVPGHAGSTGTAMNCVEQKQTSNTYCSYNTAAQMRTTHTHTYKHLHAPRILSACDACLHKLGRYVTTTITQGSSQQPVPSGVVTVSRCAIRVHVRCGSDPRSPPTSRRGAIEPHATLWRHARYKHGLRHA